MNLEAHVKPDVVLIDSRAGLHETVAANVLHLNAEVFLFAVDVPATWEGYRNLLVTIQLNFLQKKLDRVFLQIPRMSATLGALL